MRDPVVARRFSGRRFLAAGVALLIVATLSAAGSPAASEETPGEPTVVMLELDAQYVVDGLGYVPTGLRGFGGLTISADGISNDGWIVGRAERTPGGAVVAVRWAPGDVTPTALSEESSWVRGVADGGMAVGEIDTPRKPVAWDSSGVVTELHDGDSVTFSPYSVNSAGIAVGYRQTNVTVPVQWTIATGEYVDLAHGEGLWNQAYAINEVGTIVGHVQFLNREMRATRWVTPDAPSDILDVGEESSSALSVNAHGVIAGQIRFDGSFDVHPIVWEPDKNLVTQLQIGSFDDARASSIADTGSVSGTIEPSLGARTGWVWDGSAGTAQLFEGYFAMPAELNGGINDSGVVVGDLRSVPGAPSRAVRWDLRPVQFPDVVAQSPAVAGVTKLVLLGTVTGYPDGSFRPHDALTRQAAAAMVYRTAGWWRGSEPPCVAAFSDVPLSHLFCGEIAWAADSGVVQGFLDGTFRPRSIVTRQALVAMAYRSAGNPAGAAPACTSAPFSDVSTSHPLCGQIAWAAAEGLIGGFGDGTFRPTNDVTRGSASIVLAGLHDWLVAAG